MTRPVYYKSFRSMKFQNIHLTSSSILDATNQSDDVILDIGFGTGESTVALNEIFSNHVVCGIEAYKPGVKKLIEEKIPVEYGDAAEIIDSVASDALVMPSRILSYFISAFFASRNAKLTSLTFENSVCSPIINSESPGSVTTTFLSIWLRITSICL